MLDHNATSGNVRRIGHAPPPLGGEPVLDATALSVPESDPERIAFNLWNEGRVDEAIQFLEREIAAERDRHASPQEEGSDLPAVTEKIEPFSDWRDRHRAALSPAEFNAFGAPVHTIDLVAGPADAIHPHPPRRAVRPAWIIGLGLAVVCTSAAGVFLSGHAGVSNKSALAVLQPTAASEPVAPVAAAKPETEIAAIDADSNAATVEVDPDSAEDAADPDTADVPPPDDALPPESAASDSATDSPRTTASINPMPAVDEPQPMEAARLPRQRPEPPVAATSASVAVVEEPDLPQLYAPDAPPPGYAHGPAPSYDPANARPTLTPAQYQALVERRAIAEDYVARRRALAERRAMLERRVYYGGPRPFFRFSEN